MRAITTRALGDMFAPEFLGRIDETIVFRDLDPCDARSIARRQLFELASRARARGRSRGLHARGRRPGSPSADSTRRAVPASCRRVIRKELEAPLADWILDEDQTEDALVRVRIRAGEPVFERAA